MTIPERLALLPKEDRDEVLKEVRNIQDSLTVIGLNAAHRVSLTQALLTVLENFNAPS